MPRLRGAGTPACASPTAGVSPSGAGSDRRHTAPFLHGPQVHSQHAPGSGRIDVDETGAGNQGPHPRRTSG